ncbi:ESX-1 secretion-associated protein [Mycolicibacterium elephantis]|uniref:ESX-1 secretion-associated protein n=1 Tax=Mycolicibacterium elephantis TaxID=81858 RepID=UPI0007EBD2EE|nr:ESX-1 secretion-associated protein [Mycolicibacterium elephantis]OBA90010.1 hypothetical protein A5633_05955 [Mycolicibacterium elephantis]OBF00561.1 hypothetical protein A5776_09825 [Mycolicibacterium elephantis]
MSDNLYIHPDGVRSHAQLHDRVVAGLSQLTSAGAAEAVGVQTTHGAIASAVSTALSGVLDARRHTLQVTAAAGSSIAELLRQSVQMYEQGDQASAERLTD